MPYRTLRAKPPAGTAVNWGSPLARGLVGYWPMLEAGGRLWDRAGQNSAMPHPSGSVSWIAGQDGPALNFPGTGFDVVFLKTTGTIVAGLPACTIVARARTTRNGAGSSGASLYAERASAGNDLFKFDSGDATTPNHIFLTWRNDAGSLSQIRPTTLPATNDGKWHTVGLTFQHNVTGGVNLWQDGVKDGASNTISATNSFTDAGLQSWLAGDTADAGSRWQGGIAWIALWNRALTADEMRAIHLDPYDLLYAPVPILAWVPPIATARSQIVSVIG